jgi:Uma2 family endonuclease
MTDATLPIAPPPTIPVVREGMAMDDFIRRSDKEGPFEIINGEVIPKMPTVFGHGKLANRVAFLINVFAKLKNMGEAFVETTFIRPENYESSWVKSSRIPDVLYITQVRLEAYQQSVEDFASKPLMLVPDLVIEIISPTDSYSDVTGKRIVYLGDGVRLLWVVDAWAKKVMVHLPGSNQITVLSGDDVLTGGEVIPGLEIKLSDLFA